MWGRDKNFQVLVIFERKNCKNKISLGQVFFYSPFMLPELLIDNTYLYDKGYIYGMSI